MEAEAEEEDVMMWSEEELAASDEGAADFGESQLWAVSGSSGYELA